jgi:hypothetical protein
MAGKEEATPHKAATLPEGFQPNEPNLKSGTDASGKPDDSLSPKQLERAASEALHSLRPQPTALEISKALEKLAEVDDKGHPKVKVKTAKEAADKAVAALG